MSFGPTFGSFGDFVSIALLVTEICVALNESRGSAKKYQDLMQNLDVLSKSTQALENIYRDPQHAEAFDAISVTALQTVEQIRKQLEGFHGRLRKYDPSLTPGGCGNALKDVGRKLQFRLEEGDIEKFLARIVGYNIVLRTFLDITSL